MLTNDISKTVLSNGLTVLTERMSAEVETIGIGVWLKTGARHDAELNGLSHFAEHMAFKGTKTRTARQISVESDELGGTVNAYTGRETVCFHANVLGSNLEAAMAHIADLVLNARYAVEDVKQEHGVISEEAKADFDDPPFLAEHYLLTTMWGDNPLSQPITGTPESIRKISRAALRRFATERFTGCNMILGCAGNIQHAEIVQLAQKFFGTALAGVPIPNPRMPVLRFGKTSHLKDVEQVHLLIGCPAPIRTDDRFYTANLLSLVLGEGPSSRLFSSIREKRGLVYDIGSSYLAMSNAGLFDIYCGLAPENVPVVLRLIGEELRSLKLKPPSKREVARAKGKYRTEITIARESSSMGRLNTLVGPYLAYGRVLPFTEWEKRIKDVTPDQIHSLARDLFKRGRMSMSLVGNVKGLNLKKHALTL